MLEIIKPGLLTTVQDQGRWGYQGYGVGIAGAMDAFALSAANRLVGNPEEFAGLEMTIQGPTLRFQRETLFALTGADLAPRLDATPISNWAAHLAPPGSILSFGGRKSGVRAYMAVSGGIDVPLIMGSRSTYLLGRFGGQDGRPLKARDILPMGTAPVGASRLVGGRFPENLRPSYQKNPRLRAILGPFQDFFSEEGLATFLSTPYTITPNSDRMGYRLEGKFIARRQTRELITCGLANGTIQVPPNGQPILLLADRQTIGGYPIIATVIHADLPLLAQCAPGDQLSFSEVTPDQARKAFLDLFGPLRNFIAS